MRPTLTTSLARILAAASTAGTLLVPATPAVSADAPYHPPHAPARTAGAPQAGSADGALDVWFTQGSASVTRDGSLSLAGFYTCHDPDARRQAQLRIDLTAQNDAEGSLDLSGPCGVTGAPWNATVPPDADSPARFAKGVPTEAHATLTRDDVVGEEATDEAIFLADNMFVTANASATRQGDGYVVTGTYGCAADTASDELTVELTVHSDAGQGAGVATQRVACPATNRPWSATVIPAAAPHPAGRAASAASAANVEDVFMLENLSLPSNAREIRGGGAIPILASSGE